MPGGYGRERVGLLVPAVDGAGATLHDSVTVGHPGRDRRGNAGQPCLLGLALLVQPPLLRLLRVAAPALFLLLPLLLLRRLGETLGIEPEVQQPVVLVVPKNAVRVLHGEGVAVHHPQLARLIGLDPGLVLQVDHSASSHSARPRHETNVLRGGMTRGTCVGKHLFVDVCLSSLTRSSPWFLSVVIFLCSLVVTNDSASSSVSFSVLGSRMIILTPAPMGDESSVFTTSTREASSTGPRLSTEARPFGLRHTTRSSGAGIM